MGGQVLAEGVEQRLEGGRVWKKGEEGIEEVSEVVVVGGGMREEKRSIVVAFGGEGVGGGEGVAVGEPGMVPEAGHHAHAPPCVPEPAPLPAQRVHPPLVLRRGGHRRQTAQGERVVYPGGVGEVRRVAVRVCHCGVLGGG